MIKVENKGVISKDEAMKLQLITQVFLSNNSLLSPKKIELLILLNKEINQGEVVLKDFCEKNKSLFKNSSNIRTLINDLRKTDVLELKEKKLFLNPIYKISTSDKMFLDYKFVCK